MQVLSPFTVFNHEQILKFLNRNERECLHKVIDKEVFRVIRFQNELILFSIRLEGNLQISVHNIPSKQEIAEAITKYVKQWFDLDTNLEAFYQSIEADTILSKLCQKYHGLRLIGMPDLFESLIWSIIGQQINLTFAYILKERLVHNFGESVDFHCQYFYALPTPQRLAQLSIEDLRPLQFSTRKAEYIINIAKAFAEGQFSTEKLQNLSFDEIRSELIKIKGIGNWTANYSMMKSLRYYDAFPIEDVGLQNAVKNHYLLDSKPTMIQLNEMAKHWKGWKGYATFYFWHSLLE